LIPGFAQQGTFHEEVVFLEEEPGVLHLAAAGRQVELPLAAGEDVLLQDHDHVAPGPGHLGLVVDLHLIGFDAAVALAQLHPAPGAIDMGGGVVGELIGLEPPGAALKALRLEQLHLFGPGPSGAEQHQQTAQGPNPASWHHPSPQKIGPQKPPYHTIETGPLQAGPHPVGAAAMVPKTCGVPVFAGFSG
jgi:hypothetical protein